MRYHTHFAIGAALTMIFIAFSTLFIVPGNASAHLPHTDIWITGDQDFDNSSGVVWGSGTEADPYIIRGWDLGSSFFMIQNTISYFIIQDVIASSIYLESVSNAKIIGCNISFGGEDIIAWTSSNVSIIGNNLSSGDGFGNGIYLTMCTDFIVKGNTIKNCYWGISAWSCNRLDIFDNRISNGTYHNGIVLGSSHLANIKNNTLIDCGIAVYENLMDNVITPDNTINGRPVLVYKNKSNLNIDGISAGALIIGECRNIHISSIVIPCGMVGITIFDSYGLSIENCNITWCCLAAIKASNSKGIEVSCNSISQCTYGVLLEYSSDIEIADNWIDASWNYGISVEHGTKAKVIRNNVSNGYDGILLCDFSDAEITSNDVISNYDAGIIISSECFGTIVRNNNVQSTFLNGIILSSSSEIEIIANNFIDNSIQAVAIDCNSISWDNGYPGGGNYWSEYLGSDVMSGIGQDIPGSDGIGDIPYVIDSDNMDRYPLINKAERPEILMNNLIQTIKSWKLGNGLEKALVSDIENSLFLLEKENLNGAIHELLDFQNLVGTQYGKKLTKDQSQLLITQSQKIIDLIKRR